MFRSLDLYELTYFESCKKFSTIMFANCLKVRRKVAALKFIFKIMFSPEGRAFKRPAFDTTLSCVNYRKLGDILCKKKRDPTLGT